MKKKIFAMMMLSVLAFSMTACSVEDVLSPNVTKEADDDDDDEDKSDKKKKDKDKDDKDKDDKNNAAVAGSAQASEGEAESTVVTNLDENAVEYNGHHYMVYTTTQNWLNVKNACEVKGGHLVVINSAEEQQFVFNLTQGVDRTYFWIGLADDDTNNTYEWVDGSAASYTNWDNEQPDCYGGTEHYVMFPNQEVIYSNEAEGWSWSQEAGKWSDVPLDGSAEFDLNKFAYICEWDY